MKEGIEQIKRHEGFRSKVYKDSMGILTCGYGRNLEGKGITEKEALYLLSNDIQEFVFSVNKKYPWINKLNDPRRWVMYNMAFNMGVKTFSTFVNTLKAIEDERYEDAAKGMLQSRWAKQVGRRSIELSNQMKTGEWQK